MATKREIKAVRRVLYKRERLRAMVAEVTSIDVLMNTGGKVVLDPDDARIPGGGPRWLVGDDEEKALDPSVAEAADRCDRLAKLLRETRSALKEVEFDSADKRELRNALEAHARAWVARGDAWRTLPAPDVKAAVNEISRHDKEAIRSYAKVDDYLDRNALEAVR